MRTRLIPALAATFVLAVLAPAAVPAADVLESGFRNPPPQSRPHTWWHWMNGNITKEGITADLEAMARVGVGGAQIFNVGDDSSCNIPAGPVNYLTPEWLDLVHHAAAEAKRVGVELCFHNCPGWSSSGGPWITPEQSMQVVVWSEIAVAGGKRFTGKLPQPAARQGFYRDIAVVAFPTPADNAFRIEKWDNKNGSGQSYGIQPDRRPVPAAACVPPVAVADLTGKMQPDGTLAWEAPAGNWTVMRFGHTTTGKTNHPAPLSGRGLECDKLSREALDVHWNRGIQPVLDKLGPLAGQSLNNILIDSYEVGANTWTPKFRGEFQRLRGYDLLAFLPALCGRVIGDGPTSERFLWDYRRTIGDLFAANYYGFFAEKCHAAGLLCSTEPYDGPFECLAVGAQADILMGEFWVGGGEHPSVRLAASVAHTHGRAIVGAESFTSSPEAGRWQNYPGMLKQFGDQIWCDGVNRYIFHRYAHQPWTDQWPGMTMGQWGTHFERTNTWWEPGRAWMRYIARSQFLLQNGRFAADVLFFAGEASPNGGVRRDDLKQAGHDYDACGTDILAVADTKGGRIVLPAGTDYALLVLPDTPFQTPAMARKVRDLVRGGAVVLGPKPQLSPSLAGAPASDAEVKAIGDEVWGPCDGKAVKEHAFGQGRVLDGLTPAAALARLGVAPAVAVRPEGARLSWIERRAGEARVFFVSNQSGSTLPVEVSFRVAGLQPELWDPVTGETRPAGLWHAEEGGRTAVTLDLDRAGSAFVVFRKPAAAPAACRSLAAPPEPKDRNSPPPPRLTIRKAVYGVLARQWPGVADVTDELAKAVRNGRLEVVASNDLAGDPQPDVVKSLVVEYEADGRKGTVKVAESGKVALPPGGGQAARLRILGAVYGDIPSNTNVVPALVEKDITAAVAAAVRDGVLRVRADNALAGGDPAVNVPKQLRVEYELDGKPGTATVRENATLEIPARAPAPAPWRPAVLAGPRGPTLKAWWAGAYQVTKGDGAAVAVAVPEIPAPVAVAGPWNVRFQTGRGAPDEVTFDKLMPWPDHPEQGIRYFSGTASYQATFTLPAGWRAANRQVWLDLGRVAVMAEVTVNDTNLGILWHDPFRLDVTPALKDGTNTLAVAVTNLWVNRLIGDEQHPEDREWNGKALVRWPDWFLKKQPRPVPERLTFTTWRHWGKNDPLLPSGLIGPVTLRPAALVDVP